MRSVLGSASFVFFASVIVFACGGGSGGSGFDDPNANPDPNTNNAFGGDAGKDNPKPTGCTNLQCKVDACGGAPKKTTLKGVVYAPTPQQFGKPDPIYNAILYVPNGDLQPFPSGVSCDKCGAITSGEPIVTALSGPDGSFTLEGVPSGEDIPLVIQVGRWRRLVKIPKVESCVDNALTAEQTRLPRNKAEGDIPLMAIATSPYDPTECILRKIGIDAEEFTAPSKSGRVHLYKGGGASLAGDTIPAASTLWADKTNLTRYDIVAFPCQTDPTSKPDATGISNLEAYANQGGRAFITDLSESIIQGSNAWKGTANFTPSTFANPALVDTSFPKGQALADWLSAIGATPTKGQFNLQNTFGRFNAVNAPAQRWVYSTNSPQTYSFNTPVGAADDAQCGRVVYSSFHIATPTGAGASFPSECTNTPLTTQEKVLEFLLFDLSACIQKDSDAPVAPPPVVK